VWYGPTIQIEHVISKKLAAKPVSFIARIRTIRWLRFLPTKLAEKTVKVKLIEWFPRRRYNCRPRAPLNAREHSAALRALDIHPKYAVDTIRRKFKA
jgi:hypothetical protein